MSTLVTTRCDICGNAIDERTRYFHVTSRRTARGEDADVCGHECLARLAVVVREREREQKQ